ncbi:MAG: hypothetical protein PVI26_08540 [Chitinispirillia bacterium]|jgi:hypothetical protein
MIRLNRIKYFLTVLIFLTNTALFASESGENDLIYLDSLRVTDYIDIKNKIDIAKIETKIGYQDDLNSIVFMTPGVQRIPESGSQLLVNGGSVYDNKYYLNTVPMFVPAHFSGHLMFDINTLPIPTLNSYEFVTHRLPGNFSGASHSAILVEPGVFSHKNMQWHRPQVLLTLGNYDAGFCLTQQFRGGKDQYQLAANIPNTYFMKYKNERNTSYMWWDISYYKDYKKPIWYQDFSFTGESEFKNIVLKNHIWVSLDAYSSSSGKRSVIPWGAGTITLKKLHGQKPWEITIGGSKQYVEQQKILGIIAHKNIIERRNSSLLADLQKIVLGPFWVDLDIRGEYLFWKGDQKSYSKSDATTRNNFSREEVSMAAHVGIKRNIKKLKYGIDLLSGGMRCGDILYEGSSKGTSLFMDPGLWCEAVFPEGSLSLHGGIQTSFPDIRGFPDKDQRLKQIKTYSGSLLYKKDIFKKLSLVVQSYLHWKDHCPAWSDNPYEFQFEPSLTSPLLSYGISGEFRIDFNDVLSTQLQYDFNQSKRRRNNTYDAIYEWNIPLSIKPLFQLGFLRNRLNIFFSGVISEGLPYHDLIMQPDATLQYDNKVRRMPWYKRIDTKLQYDQPIDEHRYLTSFIMYLDIINVLDALTVFKRRDDTRWENVREYYWNEYLIKKPVELETASIKFGVRASFKF